MRVESALIPGSLTSRVVELEDTRRLERRAVTGVGVRLSPWPLRRGARVERRGARNGCALPLYPRLSNGPLVQRRRLLAHIQATMVRVHPGSLIGLLVQQDDASTARRK
jgi:hypothetical protein